ncbi:MAG: 50S ribosomal protein L24 [Candidatus Sungbacteria bacterium]|nr:50S ribosomal protein L24 [Candidatus Sungbacteria bacterium]
MKIHKGDNVKIISGNDKGKSGKVLAVFPLRESVRIEGLNMKKKHVRPRTQGQKGELVRVPAALRVSRVMLVCGKCSTPTRIGYTVDGSGNKQRVCKKCGAGI